MNRKNPILISWLADKHDFSGGQVNEEDPTFSFHQHFYKNYERHIILSAKPRKEGDLKLDFLANKLKRAFPDNQIETQCLGVSDVIDLEQIQAKIVPFLLSLPEQPIDVFISPGTPAMQTAWILTHLTIGLQTRLLQVRPGVSRKIKWTDLGKITWTLLGKTNIAIFCFPPKFFCFFLQK